MQLKWISHDKINVIPVFVSSMAFKLNEWVNGTVYQYAITIKRKDPVE